MAEHLKVDRHCALITEEATYKHHRHGNHWSNLECYVRVGEG